MRNICVWLYYMYWDIRIEVKVGNNVMEVTKSIDWGERIEKEWSGYSGEGEEFSGQKDPVTDIGEMHCILDGDQSRDGVRVI